MRPRRKRHIAHTLDTPVYFDPTPSPRPSVLFGFSNPMVLLYTSTKARVLLIAHPQPNPSSFFTHAARSRLLARPHSVTTGGEARWLGQGEGPEAAVAAVPEAWPPQAAAAAAAAAAAGGAAGPACVAAVAVVVAAAAASCGAGAKAPPPRPAAVARTPPGPAAPWAAAAAVAVAAAAGLEPAASPSPAALAAA